MKTITKLLILFVLIVSTVISCEKDNETIVDLNISPFIGAWVWDDSNVQYSFAFTFTQEEFIFVEHEGDFFNSDTGTYVYNDSTITFSWPENAEYVPTWIVGQYPFELNYAFIEDGLRMGERFYIKEE